MNGLFDLMDMEIEEEEREVPNAALNLRDIPVGGVFTANGIEFIRLGFEQGGVLCITKNSMFRSKFHNENDNDYHNSVIRQKILEEFVPRLQGLELIPFDMDLRAENGETDYGHCVDEAGLLTADLYRKYHYQIPTNDQDMWLATPFSCMENYPYVQYVYSSGYVGSGYYANYAFRCRPACIFAI